MKYGRRHMRISLVSEPSIRLHVRRLVVSLPFVREVGSFPSAVARAML